MKNDQKKPKPRIMLTVIIMATLALFLIDLLSPLGEVIPYFVKVFERLTGMSDEFVNMAPLRLAIFSAIACTGAAAVFCKATNMKFKFDTKSQMSWWFGAFTVAFFLFIMMTCQCTDQPSISGYLTKVNAQTLKIAPREIEFENKKAPN